MIHFVSIWFFMQTFLEHPCHSQKASDQSIHPVPNFNYSYRYRDSKSKIWPWYKDKKCFTTVSNHSCELSSADTFCFGIKIQYSHLSLSPLTHEDQLRGFSTLQALSVDFSGLPECWTLFRELICSVQYAPCVMSNQTNFSLAKLASRDLCIRTIDKCKFLTRSPDLWPIDLSICTNANMFTNNCISSPNHLEHLEFSKHDESCLYPLIYTDFQPGWHPNISKCGHRCNSHLLTESEHESLSSFMQFWIIVCGSMTLLTFVSILVNLRRRIYDCSKDTFELDVHLELNRPLAYYLFCHLLIILCFGLAQISKFRQIINCRPDGTLRSHEIAREQNYACVVQFIIIYYSLLGCCIWHCVFSVNFYLFNALSIERLKLLFQKSSSYWLHLCWSIPVVLSIYPLCFGHVESNGISGFCFLGYSQPHLLILFVYVPVSLLLGLSITFIILAFVTTKFSKPGEDGVKTRNFIGRSRLLTFYCTPLFSLIVGWIIQVLHYHQMHETRQSSFINFLQCQLRLSVKKVTLQSHGLLETCQLENRPDILMIHLHIFCFFLCTIAANFCLLTKRENYYVWIRLFMNICALLGFKFRGKSLKSSVVLSTCIENHPDEPKAATDEDIPLNSIHNNEHLNNVMENLHRSESQRTFRKRLVNRTKEYRKRAAVSRLSNSNNISLRTPSSLRSTSLSNAFNCSSTELNFTTDQPRIPNLPYQQAYPFYPMQYFSPPGFPQYMPTQNANSSEAANNNSQNLAYHAYCNFLPPFFFPQQPQQFGWPNYNNINPATSSQACNIVDNQSDTIVGVAANANDEKMPNEDDDKSFSDQSSCDSEEAELIAEQFKDSELSLDDK